MKIETISTDPAWSGSIDRVIDTCILCKSELHIRKEGNSYFLTANCPSCQLMYLIDEKLNETHVLKRERAVDTTSDLFKPIQPQLDRTSSAPPRSDWRVLLDRITETKLTLRRSDQASIWIHIAGAAIGCIDNYLQRRHTLEIFNSFVKHAHGDHNIAHREQYLELYRWFEDKLHTEES